MQTFLPYASFADSAAVLDARRLGKQRVEAWQILRTLTGASTGWRNHPAVRMWTGHVAALAAYGLACCAQWKALGYRDSLTERFVPYSCADPEYPQWIGREDFHRSHRSNLVRKDPAWYRHWWPDVDDTLPYVWPVETATPSRTARFTYRRTP